MTTESRSVLVAACMAALMLALPMSARAAPLWYNGDVYGAGGSYVDGINLNTFGTALIYDDFIVPAGGWDVQSVFMIGLVPTDVTNAYWEIRSGVSAGNGGTLVASGNGPATLTPVGSFWEKVEVSGLSLALTPGTYWLAVGPDVASSADNSSISQTIGANAVGLPAGNNANAFAYSSFAPLGWNFSSIGGWDFSMGVTGEAIPEPATLSLLAAGALLLTRRKSGRGRE